MRTTVHQLQLGHVVLPDAHPRSAEGSCVLLGYVIDHPDGLIVVDTGTQAGHPVIDSMYAPQVVSVIDALHNTGFDEREVAAVVNTHLHFDHCGQNHLFEGVPTWVTRAELEAARAEFYTVPEWAEISSDRLRIARDGELVAAGVQLVHTPGHTPGHQSIAVTTSLGLEVIVGQACYSCAEFKSGPPAPTDMHDEVWRAAGAESLDRLRSLRPRRAYFSHDATIWE